MGDRYLRPRVRLNEYLDRAGVASNLQSALLLVLENKPDDPIYFLSQFFRNACTENADISTAYQNLMLVHHSRPTFLRHVKKTFIQLASDDSSTSITGKIYNELLNLITRDLNSSIQRQLLSHLEVDDESSVIFDVFYWGIRDSLLFIDFYSEAVVLYESLDVNEKGEITCELYYRLLYRLQAANQLIINSKSLIESVQLLSTGAITETVNEVYNEMASHKMDTMKKQEFLEKMCELFFDDELNAKRRSQSEVKHNH
ncbi:Tubulin polyglutamylase complex subunit 1 [Trichoplax sp. H2]|nr:Tubulin polyglutamylase complex subunit 1 [Trichoplax sp. H2]|eukprot:RDD41016.1 Tubulin polyglutamylase complex subunit 1 [Trichoplax sp. H2]